MKTNRGFSMVELIIVIAIMVALVAVLAPQFLKYVEASREAADGANADAVVGTLQIVLADSDVTWVANGSMDFDLATGAITSTDAAVIAEMILALGAHATEADAASAKPMKSKVFGTSGKVTIRWDANSLASVNVPDAAYKDAWANAVAVTVTVTP